MSRRRHAYRHLDHDNTVRVELTMRDLAERVEDSNYGVQRFLSHLVDVRRERLAERIKTYTDRGDHDVAEYARREGDPLIESIAKLLDEGAF